MDAHAQDQQHKDFMSTLNFFPGAGDTNHHRDSAHNQHQHQHQHLHQQQQQQQQQGMFTASALTQPNMLAHSMHPNNGAPMDLDLIGSFMAMQGVESQGALSPGPHAAYNPAALLEQQFKLTQLQQLQQLQQQIFQQQIALISGGQPAASGSDAAQDQREPRPVSFSGLPTPGNSTELRPQPNNEYVSPMILQYMDAPHESYQTAMLQSPHLQSGYMRPHGASSAPASIAFQQTAAPLSADDFDVSPLTSPWLGAHQTQTQHPHPHQRQHPHQQEQEREQEHQQALRPRPPNKRTASASASDADAEEQQPARKRQSPAIRPTNANASANANAKKGPRMSKSTSSTPLMRSARARRDSNSGIAEHEHEHAHDTPSPVDLSMPPPAPPSMPMPMQGASPSPSSALAQSQSQSQSHYQYGGQLSPATPATMMNLGRLALRSGLTPAAPEGRKADRGKSAAKPRSADGAGAGAGTRKAPKRGVIPGASPGLKSILPAGDASALHLGPAASASASAPPAPPAPVRKTSHKAAEQKRRDMLKTTFDDLRALLPPVPLPSDADFPAEPILPGALPPRGPPRAGADGPNRGISKLQLLRCGNDFVRLLKGRVERRDGEIARLRGEVGRLRGIAGMAAFTVTEDGEGEGEALDLGLDLGLDLERDLDAIEATMGNGFRRELTGGDEDDDDGF